MNKRKSRANRFKQKFEHTKKNSEINNINNNGKKSIKVQRPNSSNFKGRLKFNDKFKDSKWTIYSFVFLDEIK